MISEADKRKALASRDETRPRHAKAKLASAIMQIVRHYFLLGTRFARDLAPISCLHLLVTFPRRNVTLAQDDFFSALFL